MIWKVISSDSFAKEFKKFKNDGKFVKVVAGKIERLKENPNGVGGYLTGRLYGYKSTRIVKNFRLIFKIDKEKGVVVLSAIDKRKFNYERF